MLTSFPEEWQIVTGSEFVVDPKSDIVDGPFGSNLKASEYTDSGVPIARIQNVKRFRFVDKNIRFVTIEKAEELHRHSFVRGDILITKLGDPLGLACEVPESFDYGIIVADLVRLRPNLKVCDKSYVIYLLNSDVVTKQIETHVKGTTRPRINLGVIRNLSLPLASLSEQKVIADKLDKLLAQVETTKARLERIPETLKTFRQSVLAAAVSGKLTKDWREVNREKSAEMELKNIISKKDALASNRKKQVLPPVCIELDDLPVQWTYSDIQPFLDVKRAGMKTGPFGSLLKKSEHQNKGIPVIGIENISEDGFKFGSKIHISSEKALELNGYDLAPGDIVISRSGTVGETCVIPRDIGEARFSTNIMRISFFEDSINPFFYRFLFIGSTVVLKQLQELCKGSTRLFLNQKILSSIRYPIPPLEEQTEIVRRVEELFAYADSIEQKANAALERVSNLTQSILAKAFRGELTADWREANPALISGENSAEALLKRIKDERELEKKANKSKKKTNRKHKSVKYIQPEIFAENSVVDVINKKGKAKPQEIFDELKELMDLREVLREVSQLLEQEVIKETDMGGQQYLVINR